MTQITKEQFIDLVILNDPVYVVYNSSYPDKLVQNDIDQSLALGKYGTIREKPIVLKDYPSGDLLGIRWKSGDQWNFQDYFRFWQDEDLNLAIFECSWGLIGYFLG